MRSFWTLVKVETKLFFREKQAVFWTFLFPILMIWLFGAMFGNTKISGMSYSDAYVPSWIAVNLLTTSLFTLGTTLAGYRERGILRRYQATPVRSWMIVASHMAYGVVVFLFSAAIMIVFGAVMFHLTAPKHPLSVIATVILSMAALLPFGVFISSMAKGTRTAAAISSLLLNLMLFLSGATFPLPMMPKVLQDVARILPLYYVIDLMRQTWNFSSIAKNGLDVIVLGAMAIVFSGLAAKWFRWSAD